MEAWADLRVVVPRGKRVAVHLAVDLELGQERLPQLTERALDLAPALALARLARPLPLPVHVNLPFRVPLVGTTRSFASTSCMF